jgi:hypothetical protein
LRKKPREVHRCLLQLKRKCKKWKQVKRLVVVFYNLRKITKDNDELGSWLVVIFCTWWKKPSDDDKPGGSSLSFAPKEKSAENDNELGGSLSSSTTEAKQLRMTMSPNPSSS